jgi:class 3 adenylate cyclase/CHASE2 domain-containing sensor protein
MLVLKRFTGNFVEKRSVPAPSGQRLVGFKLLARSIGWCMASIALVLLWCWFQWLEIPCRDAMMKWTAAPVGPKSPVVLVLLDTQSLDRLQPEGINEDAPVRSEMLGSLVRQIIQKVQQHQPALVVLDGHGPISVMQTFNAPERHIQKHDPQTPPIIMGQAVANQPERLLTDASLEGSAKNAVAFTPSSEKLFGVVNTEGDYQDGVIRRIRPFRTVPQQNTRSTMPPRTLEALSVVAARHYFSAISGKQSPTSSSLPSASRPSDPILWQAQLKQEGWIPKLFFNTESAPSSPCKAVSLTPENDLLLKWYRSHSLDNVNGHASKSVVSHPFIPAWQLFEYHRGSGSNLTLQEQLKNKVVFIGTALPSHQDTHPTPMSFNHLGVDIHATAFDNILASETLFQQPTWVNQLLALALFGGIIFLRLLATSVKQTIAYSTVLIMGYLIVAFLGLVYFNSVLDIVTPLGFMALGLLVASTLKVSQEGDHVKALERTLAQTVSPSVLTEMKRQHLTLETGGQRRTLSVLFVDIRNFTGMSQKLSEAQLTTLLNAFYTQVEEIAFKHHGMIDKFMGDGVLVLFGAPIRQEDHAHLALACAQEMRQQLDVFFKQCIPGMSVHYGISVHSGEAFVGFFGPAHRLEYTAIGDTVNVCIRLQQHNKRLGYQLLTTEATTSLVTNTLNKHAFKVVETVTVTGRQGNILLYTIV